MPSFGRKIDRNFGKFAKKMGIKHNFGKKLVSGLSKAGSVVSRIADVAMLVNPELAPLALGVKSLAKQAPGLGKSAVALTGKRPDLEKISGELEQFKQTAKETAKSLQKKKPEAEDSGVQFA